MRPAKAVALFLLGLFLCALPVEAAEVISDFRSDVSVEIDGTVKVTETISVVAEGHNIKRGIFRDFPTVYESPEGGTVTVPFEVSEVTRDGRPEKWSTEGLSNGVRVRIGNPDHLLSRGEHRYTISYTTARQIGFYEEYDELYWNVTGNGWMFPIEKASCTVNLPEGAKILQTGAWTGIQGSKDRHAVMEAEGGEASFAITRPLAPGEGLTIALSWPKGIVAPPAKNAYFMTDHGLDLAFGGTVLIGLIYFFWAWLKVGKDPKKGLIVPRFLPPEGMSPAAVRQLSIMGFDGRSFSSAIISLAVKGYLVISEEEGFFKKYKITKTPEDRRKGTLPPEEKRLFDTLLGSRESILLKQENHETLGAAKEALSDSLNSEYGRLYDNNLGYGVTGVLIMVAILVPSFFLFGRGEEEIFFGLGVTVATLVMGFMVMGLIRNLRKTWRENSGFKAFFKILIKTLGLLLTLFLMLMAISLAFYVLSPICAMTMPIIAFIPVFFIPILRAPTKEGRILMDEIEGFSMYIKVAEEDRLNLLNPPEKTPELFERYLPYALALGLEQKWGEKFASVLSSVDSGDGGYNPTWYVGSAPLYAAGMGDFASSLGSSFSDAISSASTAPGSDSAFSGGGGGGGSAGGGGGGGGGGGW